MLEGTELRNFLMSLDEFQITWRRMERRLRDPRVVEVLARRRAGASTPRPTFSEKANLQAGATRR